MVLRFQALESVQHWLKSPERARMLTKVVWQCCRASMLPANPFQLLTQVEPLLTSKSSAVATRSRHLPDAFTDLLVQVGVVVSQ